MPEILREVTVPLPIGQVWEFIADMNNWAKDIPGYCTHEMKSETESVWQLKGELGPFTRELEARVLITEWVAQNRVKFTMEGVYEPVKGGGQLSITADGPTQTTLVMEMALGAKGLMAPVINPLLSKMAPGMCEQFVAALYADLLKAKTEVPVVPS